MLYPGVFTSHVRFGKIGTNLVLWIILLEPAKLNFLRKIEFS